MSKIILEKKKENEKLTVAAEGRIDTSTSAEFDMEVKSALEDDVTELVMDFARLNYISSSGLRVLLSLHKMMAARGGSLTIINPTKIVNEVFDVTGFKSVLKIQK